MRLAPAQHRAYSYTVTEAPGTQAVGIEEVKNHLKVTGTNQDALISLYLDSAIDYAEKFTRRDFITRTYKTFRDSFPGISEGYYQFGGNASLGSLAFAGGNLGFEIRRSKFQSVELVQYFKLGVLTTVDAAIYYNTIEDDYSEILTIDGGTWPEDADRRLQAIQITFKSGFGDAETDMPSWIAEGVIQHVADMYANRGDCGDFGDSKGMFLPRVSRMLYLQNRIENL